MAPRNETPEDLQNEREVAAVLADAWNCDLKKLTEDRLYLADYAVVEDGDIKAFVEIRCRSCSSTTYPTLYIPLHKVLWAQSVFASTKTPYLYVVRFDGDGVIAYRLIAGGGPYMAGMVWAERRTERDTHPDGPVLEIMSDSFKVLARENHELDI